MKRKRGIGLIELTMMLSFVLACVLAATSMTVGVGKSWERTSTQLKVDQTASKGIQWITEDMQEAKSFQILSSSWIRVYYPVVDANGNFNRKVTDTVNYVEYYRGNSNGSRSDSGTCLVRWKVGSNARAVCKDVILVNFESESPSALSVDLQVRTSFGGDYFTCAMNHRAILMRNYMQ